MQASRDSNSNLVVAPDAIKDMRKRMGWTASDLARRMNSNSEEIAKWEAGESFPNVSQQRLLDLLLKHVESLSDELQCQMLVENILDKGDLQQVEVNLAREYLQD
jgi:ribosome-binding protein aMBF1 (putative translation factor)